MAFYGRSFDTFESAVIMLAGDELSLRHIDCISGRSFSLCRENASELYSCTLSVEHAVDNLNRGFGNVFSVVSPHNLFEPFVMQMQTDMGIPVIFRKYFPQGHYVLCCRKGDTININDPDGFPCLSFSAEEFNFSIQPVIVRAGTNPATETDVNAIMQDGFKLRHKPLIPCDNISLIFLQYAVRNFICQTNKVLIFMSEHIDIPIPIQKEVRYLFSNMLTKTTKEIEEVFDLDEKIWMLLEDLWRSKI